jgi:hypothetical protein
VPHPSGDQRQHTMTACGKTSTSHPPSPFGPLWTSLLPSHAAGKNHVHDLRDEVPDRPSDGG